MRPTLGIVLSTLILVVACSAQSTTPLSTAGGTDLLIGPGDLLEIGVFDTPELSAKVRVSKSGQISLPLVGEVSIAGLSVGAAQQAIRQRLIGGKLIKDPQVVIFVSEYATQGVSVVGEVNKPGIFPAVASRRLLDYVSLAQGLTRTAGTRAVIQRRGDANQIQTVNLFPGADALSPDSNPEIQPGDTIVISKAGIVYVVGDVARAGGFVMEHEDRMSALQALAMAQGANKTASLAKARIIRKVGDGHKEIPLNLKRVLQSQGDDVTLQNEDILFVPASGPRNAATRGIEAALQVATGIAIYRRN